VLHINGIRIIIYVNRLPAFIFPCTFIFVSIIFMITYNYCFNYYIHIVYVCTYVSPCVRMYGMYVCTICIMYAYIYVSMYLIITSIVFRILFIFSRSIA
jgi:hypothetical protein